MAQCQVEGGASGGGGEGGGGEGGEEQFEQILPTDQLLAIYQRITENEIKVGAPWLARSVPHGPGAWLDCSLQGNSPCPPAPAPALHCPTRGPLPPFPPLQVHGEEEAAPAAAAAPAGPGKRGGERSRRGARLAAAVGVSQMVLPFWSGATWDKQHGVDVERKRWAQPGRAAVQRHGAAGGDVGPRLRTCRPECTVQPAPCAPFPTPAHPPLPSCLAAGCWSSPAR